MKPKNTLLIFAKEPVAGTVKTRLIPTLSAENASDLYEKLLEHTLIESSKLLNTEVILYCVNVQHQAEHCYDQAIKAGFSFRQQTGVDLGDRMKEAFSYAFRWSERVILIGTDSLEYSTDYLRQAFSMLASNDAVLGPASDGGYVLIGLTRSHPDIFRDIPWSSDSVLSVTRQRLLSLGWQWAELETLNDIDTPADLVHVQHLIQQLNIGTTRN